MKKFLHSLPLVLGFAAFIVLTFVFSWSYFERRTEDNVSKTEMSSFPVAVFTADKAEIVALDMDLLKDFEAKNPNYSYLMPDGDEKLINQQLEKSQVEKYRKGTPIIKVERISEEKQLIELKIVSDGFIVSKYEASKKEVKPLTLKSAGPGFIFFPCGTTFFIGFLGFVLLRFILWFLKKDEKQYL